MGKIVILMGPSSCGKDTLKYKLLKQNIFDLKEIKLHTTRPKRSNEKDGVEYYFDTEKQMREYEENKSIIERRCYQTEYGPWYYYTTDKNINLKNHNYITLNTLEGYDSYLKHYQKEEIISCLIELEEGLRLERALQREKQNKNPKYDELCRRFLADKKDFSEEELARRMIDYRINNNGSIEESVKEINKILKKEL